MTRIATVRLLITAAVTLMLLTCTVAAWAMPHTRPYDAAAHMVPVASAGDRCDLIAGPARDVCRSLPCESVAAPGPSAAAALSSPPLDGKAMLLLFSTVAVAAAIGLVTTAERRL